MTRRVLVTDDVVRSGPWRAWWVRVTPRRHGPTGISLELPTGRARAWNVAAVLFAAGDLYVAHRVGVLGWVLAAVAGMVAAGGVGLVLIQRRIDRQAAERLAAYWAARAAGPVSVDSATERPAPEREQVAA